MLYGGSEKSDAVAENSATEEQIPRRWFALRGDLVYPPLPKLFGTQMRNLHAFARKLEFIQRIYIVHTNSW